MVVVESALSAGESLKRFRWGGTWGILWRPRISGGYWQEACSYSRSSWAVREMGRGLRSPELFVRRQAACGLHRQGSVDATRELMAVVRKEIRQGRIPLDIEGAEIVRQAMDGVLRNRPEGGVDFLAEVFEADLFRVHDLHQRAALALGFLSDDRCLELEPESQLPGIVEALISPLQCRPDDPLRDAVERLAPQIGDWLDSSPVVGEEKTPHLRRVEQSRTWVAAGRAYARKRLGEN